MLMATGIQVDAHGRAEIGRERLTVVVRRFAA
jgi:hypothetical protein